MAEAKKYTARKYDGDDLYSWAVFRTEDLKGLGQGVIFYGDAPPILTGMDQTEARWRANRMNERVSA